MCDRATLHDSRSVGRSVTVQNPKVNKMRESTKKYNQEVKKNSLLQERWKLRRLMEQRKKGVPQRSKTKDH